MHLIRLSLLVAAGHAMVLGSTVSYIDPFGTAATSCAASSCDVIGDPFWFDLDRLSLTLDSTSLSAQLSTSLNFGPGADLTPFYDFGIKLSAADVLFAVNGTIRYGIALTAHEPGLLAGNLYTVASPAGVLTASDVLHLSAGYVYRPDAPVWLHDDGQGSIVASGAGSVLTFSSGNGIDSGRLTVNVSFVVPPEFLADFNSGAMSVIFASATCGNDILDPGSRVPDGIPEPSSAVLVLIGFVFVLRYKLHDAAAMIRRVLRS